MQLKHCGVAITCRLDVVEFLEPAAELVIGKLKRESR